MADVDIAFNFTMHNEDPTGLGKVTIDNNGGKVRFGVNSVAHPEALHDGFYVMPLPEALDYAKTVYVKDYWVPVHGYLIDNQPIANKVTDLSFDMNPMPMVRVTQRAVNFVMGRLVLEVDGEMGPKTLALVNGIDAIKLLPAIKSYAKQRYEDIVRAHPEDQPYLMGWLRRVDV